MMDPSSDGNLVIAISSRALFDLSESHRIFQQRGVEAYSAYQIANENEPLAPGVAFPLVSKLLALNALLDGRASIEVILLSRNSADTGLRIFNSIEHHNLHITRAAFTGGSMPFRYIDPLGAHLFLSADREDVEQALKAGVAAAAMLPSGGNETDASGEELRIAFDGDAVLFSDEAERIYQTQGLKAFEQSEREAAHSPLQGGPFQRFFLALHRIQKIPEASKYIRTALITARSAPAHERVIRTLRDWQVRIDEALFLGGRDKGAFLKAFGADIFFDDHQGHCDSARQHVPTGHVPVRDNEPKKQESKDAPIAG